MLNFLFWNLRRNAIEDYVIDCLAENNIDIAAFSEYEGIDFSKIEITLGNFYRRIQGVQVGGKVSLFVKKSLVVEVVQQQHRYNIYIVKTGVKDYILSTIHLEDRRNNTTADRIATINNLVTDIEKTEELLKCNNTIVIGDFNANPYDEELLSRYAFNAVLFKNVINSSEITTSKGLKRKRFYNPILNYISEDTGMYGSFYHAQNHNTPYWHCLDQVLVRKSLVNCVVDMKYLKEINSRELLNKIAPNKKISDHLPLMFGIKEVENDV